MSFGDNDYRKYFTVYNGKFSIRVPKGTPGSKDRINKVGKEVSEIYKDFFVGTLVNIRTKTSETYGKSWEFDFRDNGEIWTLQLSYSNSSAKNLIKILPNADLAQEMKIQISMKMVENKPKTSIFVAQNGVTLKHKYTRANPNGMPDMEEITVKGVKQLDDTKQLEFLQSMVEADLLPKLPRDTGASASKEDDALAVEEGTKEAGADDDF